MKRNCGKISKAIIALVLCMVMGLMCTAPALASVTKSMQFDKYYKIPTTTNELIGKFKTTARGYVKLTLSGDIYTAEVYKGSKLCWTANSLLLKKGGKQVYNIGLDKGSYKVNLRGSSGAKMMVTFTKNSYYEIEPNNKKATATKLKLAKYYGGVFGDCASVYVNQAEDYYKVKLEKGKEYTVSFSQYKKLFGGDRPMAFVIVEGPDGVRRVNADSEYALSMTTLPTTGKVKITANQSGYFRIILKPGWWDYKKFGYKIKVN